MSFLTPYPFRPRISRAPTNSIHQPTRPPQVPSLSHREDGLAIIEMAITLPILLTFVLGFIQVCFLFYTYDAISELAREGTRYAIVRGATCTTSYGTSCTATASDVNTFVSGIGLLNSTKNGMQIATTYPDGNQAPGSRVKVTVQYVYGFTLPFTNMRPLSITASSQAFILQ